MSSKLPLLPSGPGGVRKSTIRGPWHQRMCCTNASASRRNPFVISMTAFMRGAKVTFGLSEINQGFEAGLFHPDFGNEVVNGRLFLDRWKLRFQSDTVLEEISMDALEIDFEQGTNRIYFNDPDRPELKIFTSDQAVLRH